MGMSYQETYESTIWNVIQLLSTYKSYVEQNDLNNLYKTKAILVAEKAKLNQICSDANGFYLEKKSELSDKKDELYLMYCETDTNGVAERKSRLDTKDLRDDCNRLKTQRNKSGKLLEDVNSIIIEIAIILKDKKNQETYG